MFYVGFKFTFINNNIQIDHKDDCTTHYLCACLEFKRNLPQDCMPQTFLEHFNLVWALNQLRNRLRRKNRLQLFPLSKTFIPFFFPLDLH